MAISRVDFSFLISAMIARNPTMGILALEDGLFVNLFILNYLYMEIGGAEYRSVDRKSCS